VIGRVLSFPVARFSRVPSRSSQLELASLALAAVSSECSLPDPDGIRRPEARPLRRRARPQSNTQQELAIDFVPAASSTAAEQTLEDEDDDDESTFEEDAHIRAIQDDQSKERARKIAKLESISFLPPAPADAPLAAAAPTTQPTPSAHRALLTWPALAARLGISASALSIPFGDLPIIGHGLNGVVRGTEGCDQGERRPADGRRGRCGVSA
jgi:hypothetical protein